MTAVSSPAPSYSLTAARPKSEVRCGLPMPSKLRPRRSTEMQARVDSKRFGPWALITGASSGIGREFARQIAASHINVGLVARRRALLESLGTERWRHVGVMPRVLAADLSDEGFIAGLADATRDLDIGLVISNAGTGNPGRFIDKDREELAMTLRLSALAHAELALHFGRKLAERGTGGRP